MTAFHKLIYPPEAGDKGNEPKLCLMCHPIDLDNLRLVVGTIVLAEHFNIKLPWPSYRTASRPQERPSVSACVARMTDSLENTGSYNVKQIAGLELIVLLVERILMKCFRCYCDNSFKNYAAFLQAFQNGSVRRLVVVARRS